jgi:hypothetical protein
MGFQYRGDPLPRKTFARCAVLLRSGLEEGWRFEGSLSQGQGVPESFSRKTASVVPK